MTSRRWMLPVLLSLLTVLAIVLVLYFNWQQYHSESQLLAEQNLVAMDVAYRSSVEMYRLDVEARYHAITHRPDVLELLRSIHDAADDEMPLIRGRLYRLLHKDYRQMVKVGLRQFHFHLPDDRTLLRFHRPEWVDDNQLYFRPSVRMANSERRVISGFEHGRSLPAFRNVFPVEEEGRLLCTIEISLPFEKIHDNLITLLPAGDYALLLARDALFNKLDPSQYSKFIETELHPEYFQEHPSISRVSRNFVESTRAQSLNHSFRQIEEVQQKMDRRKRFAYPTIHQGQGFVASFYPITDLEKKHAAYLVAYVETPLLTRLRNTAVREAVVMSVLIATLALVLWLLYRQHQQLSAELLRKQRTESELQRSNDELEQFAYAISHDMRQPLRMISGHIGLLERALADRLDQDAAESMRFAIDGAKRMDDMILSLLNYSRVGRKTEPMSWLQSREAVDEALQFLGPAIADASARVDVTGTWPRIHASRDEISRLFQNLIGNAIKYRLSGTSPTISVYGEMQSSGNWRVRICDDGIGIPTDQQARLFKVFSRLHKHQGYEGTGVGLALCRKIIEHHDGQIGVESAGSGKGSCFWFVLPMHDEGER